MARNARAARVRFVTAAHQPAPELMISEELHNTEPSSPRFVPSLSCEWRRGQPAVFLQDAALENPKGRDSALMTESALLATLTLLVLAPHATQPPASSMILPAQTPDDCCSEGWLIRIMLALIESYERGSSTHFI